jgi:hypothetical protein
MMMMMMRMIIFVRNDDGSDDHKYGSMDGCLCIQMMQSHDHSTLINISNSTYIQFVFCRERSYDVRCPL